MLQMKSLHPCIMGCQLENLESETPPKLPQSWWIHLSVANSSRMSRELQRKFRQPEGSYAECAEVIHPMITVELGLRNQVEELSTEFWKKMGVLGKMK